ncbi:MAG TPA: DUF3105 domain-containing protein [Candidatus Limnocylindrales bacterium]
MSESKDDEMIILPSLMSYRDKAFHGFVPPPAGTIEVKAAGRRKRRLATGAVASVALIGLSAFLLIQAAPRSEGPPVAAWPSPTVPEWEARANQIEGIVNFRASGTQLSQDHTWGPLTYDQSPPVGGKHSPVWQQCMGNTYDAPIASEHAVHSLEHGAVWLAYRSELPAAEVDILKNKIKGKQYTFMAPYDGLETKVSLQAWGYQLKVDDVNDSRIDDFISLLAKNTSLEPEASCASGNTATGTTPLTEQQALERFRTG